MHKTFSPKTHGVYFASSGIPITRANINDEQARRAEDKQSPATADEIVYSFATPVERKDWKNFTNRNRYQKLVARASGIMRK